MNKTCIVKELTSLLFREGVLLDDEEPLRLGGRSIFTLSPFVLPFSRISLPGPPSAGCSPFGCGDCASCKPLQSVANHKKQKKNIIK